MEFRCIIIDDMHPSIVPMLKKIDINADYRPTITKQELIEIIGDYEGIIARSKFKIDKTLLDKASRLKFIARAGAGLDMIDLEEVEKRGILLINAPEGNRDAVAEHTLALLLSLLNNISRADTQVRQGIWQREQNRGHELKSKTVALIGYGFMGKAVAKRLSSFECEVIAYDKYLKDYSDNYVTEVNMQEVLERADIVSFHVPLTNETSGMGDNAFFSSFKKSIWVINTARGEVIKLQDLLEMMDAGKVRGAGLDVLEHEKINKLQDQEKEVFERLTLSEKVILTPHIAGWTYESYERINETLVYKINNSGIVKKA